LSLDHSALTGLGDFITSLGDLVKTPVKGTTPNDLEPGFGPGGCGCHVAGGPSLHSPSALVGLGLLLAGLFGRRRQRG
jgi:MYXO-CTERM domain-containing protein